MAPGPQRVVGDKGDGGSQGGMGPDVESALNMCCSRPPRAGGGPHQQSPGSGKDPPDIPDTIPQRRHSATVGAVHGIAQRSGIAETVYAYTRFAFGNPSGSLSFHSCWPFSSVPPASHSQALTAPLALCLITQLPGRRHLRHAVLLGVVQQYGGGGGAGGGQRLPAAALPAPVRHGPRGPAVARPGGVPAGGPRNGGGPGDLGAAGGVRGGT